MIGTMLGTDAAELAAESVRAPFDAIVVGGGSAGLTAARTLAERGRRVALLEAGGVPFLTHISNTELRFDRALSDNLRNQVQYGPKLANGDTFGPNFSCLGGRGLFWNGASPRFRAHDFMGWPFSAIDLAPYYDWAEQEFRVTTKLSESRLATSIIELLRKSGFEATAAPFAADLAPLRHGRLSAGIASGLSLFFRGAGAAISAGRIRIATTTLATRLILAQNEARGVLARSQGGEEREILGRSVVLAGGGVESIRLAQVSRVPDKSGRVGLGIQDHIFYRTFSDAPHLYEISVPEAAAVFVPSETQRSEQWELHAPGRRLFAVDDGSAWAPGLGDGYHVMVRSFSSTEKRDANRVEAHEGTIGSTTVHFDYSEADKKQRTAIKERFGKLAGALGLVLKEERFAGPGGSYHEAGGLDMGTDPATSVTSPDGRFHQVPNLVCVDAAAWPRIGATNPHLTIVAIARRQTEMLSSRL